MIAVPADPGAAPAGTLWLLDFHHERRGTVVRYAVGGLSPADAVRRGWAVLRAEHPATAPVVARTLFQRARRSGGRHASGWVLHRLVRNGGSGAPGPGTGPAPERSGAPGPAPAEAQRPG